MVHEFEEIIYLTTWSKKNLNKILEKAPKPFHKMVKESARHSQALFSFAVFEEFILLSLLLLLYVFFFSGMLYLLVLSLAGYLFHVAIHIIQSIYLKMYIPAVGTGILSSIYSIYAIIFLTTNTQINWSLVILLIPIVTIIIIINLKFSFFIGKKIVKE